MSCPLLWKVLLVERYRPKIVHAGFHRTAGASVARAFQLLGYTTIWHPANTDIFNLGGIARLWRGMALWRGKYRVRDAQFIEKWLKQIDSEGWHQSMVNLLKQLYSWQFNCLARIFPLCRDIQDEYFPAFLDVDRFVKDKVYARSFFDKTLQEIREEVAKERLLIFDVREKPWEQLCTFLGKEVPNKSFPRVNGNGEIARKIWRTCWLVAAMLLLVAAITIGSYRGLSALLPPWQKQHL